MLFKGSNRSEDYWISVSDLMAGLMIIFLFIAVSYMIKTKSENEMFVYIEQEYEIAQNAIYEALYDEFKDDLDRWDAELDKESLSFIFLSPDVLFETGKSDLQVKYKRILDDFFPRYIVTLHNVIYPIQTYYEENGKRELITVERFGNENISAIRIEGHANILAPRQFFTENQKFVYNMRLSSDRAQSVLSYVLNLDLNDLQPWVRDNVRAVGYSSSKPSLNTSGSYDFERSKRVEFRIVLDAQEKLFELIQRRNEGSLNEINYLINNDVLRSEILDKYRQELSFLESEILNKNTELRKITSQLKSIEDKIYDLEIEKYDLGLEIDQMNAEIKEIRPVLERLKDSRQQLVISINMLKSDQSKLEDKIINLKLDIEYYEDVLAGLKDEYGDDNRAYDKYLKNEFNQEEMNRPSNPSWLKDDNFNESETIMEAPILLGKITPVYPTAAQNKGIKGFVRLSFIIDVNGKAKDIEIIRATSGFSRAAILAIERAEWIPAKRNGIPFEYRTSQNFNFDPKDIK